MKLAAIAALILAIVALAASAAGAACMMWGYTANGNRVCVADDLVNRNPTFAEPPPWTATKIKDAREELLRRGVRDWRAELSYIYSIDENRGRFRDAEALADWIVRGDP